MAIDLRTQLQGQLPVSYADESTTATPDGSAVPVRSATVGQASTVGASATDTVGVVQGGQTATKAANYTTSNPDLPSATGTTASVSTAANVVSGMANTMSASSGFVSAAEAYSILQKSQDNNFKLAATISRAANQTAITAKVQEAEDKLKEVQGSREHALNSFMTSALSAGATLGVGVAGSAMARPSAAAPELKAGTDALSDVGKAASAAAGGEKSATAGLQGAASSKSALNKAEANQAETTASDKMGNTADQLRDKDKIKQVTEEKMSSREAWGAGLTQSGQAVGQVVTSVGDLWDKTSPSGGQYKADQAMLAQKEDAVESQIAEATKDSAKSSVDQSLESMKNAQQAIQSYSQRWTEVYNNIANR